MIWKTSSRKQSEHGRHGHWCESVVTVRMNVTMRGKCLE